MNSKHIMTAIACAAALCGSVRADNQDEKSSVGLDHDARPSSAAGWNWAMGEGLSYNETPVVSAEVSLAFDSKYLSYGYVDNKDPILTPAASITLFDWFYVGVESVFDVTKYGNKAYADENGDPVNRGGKYTELDPGAGFAHSFSSEDHPWLPTTVAFDLNYMYEYHPRSYNTRAGDTQFITLEVSLPDLWIEPKFVYERDIDRDNGTYLNLELGHTFELLENVTLRPSVAQGFGTAKRVGGSAEVPYATKEDGMTPLGHAGLMDTFIKAELAWEIVSGVTLSGYVGYSDFLFDRKIREAARRYEASGEWDDSWNFVAGLSLALAF